MILISAIGLILGTIEEDFYLPIGLMGIVIILERVLETVNEKHIKEGKVLSKNQIKLYYFSLNMR